MWQTAVLFRDKPSFKSVLFTAAHNRTINLKGNWSCPPALLSTATRKLAIDSQPQSYTKTCIQLQELLVTATLTHCTGVFVASRGHVKIIEQWKNLTLPEIESQMVRRCLVAKRTGTQCTNSKGFVQLVSSMGINLFYKTKINFTFKLIHAHMYC
jgi:hypothetical protein